jgi:uncharacterized metal-binding protein
MTVPLQVWSFYSSAPNYKWRGKLALVLFELQQAGDAALVQQVCVAGARVWLACARAERSDRCAWVTGCPCFWPAT